MTTTTDTLLTSTGQLLGYARVSTGHQSLDAQTDALTAAGVDPARVYADKLTGTSAREQRPAWPGCSTTPGPATPSWSSASTAWAATPPRSC